MRVRTHPGEVLRCEFLEPLGLSARALAEAIDVPGNRISDIVREHRGMTADTALRLARYFSTTPEFWMNLQTAHDLSKAEVEREGALTGDARPKGKRPSALTPDFMIEMQKLRDSGVRIFARASDVPKDAAHRKASTLKTKSSGGRALKRK